MRWFGKTWGAPPPAARRVRPPAWVEADAATSPAPGDEPPPRGCAWFDSSHELRTGLVVREVRPGPELQRLLCAQAPGGEAGAC